MKVHIPNQFSRLRLIAVLLPILCALTLSGVAAKDGFKAKFRGDLFFDYTDNLFRLDDVEISEFDTLQDPGERFYGLLRDALRQHVDELFSKSRFGDEKRRLVLGDLVADHVAVLVDSKNRVGDRLGERHQLAIDESNHHDRRHRARLNEGCHEEPDPDGEESVGRDRTDRASNAGARDNLKALLHVLHAKQEDTQSADDVKTHF